MGSEPSSHGSVRTSSSPATSAGDRVKWSASSGSAILNTPSARLERPDDATSVQKERPRRLSLATVASLGAVPCCTRRA